jgi:hypothetical protein
MPDLYGIAADDIAAELRGIFPLGFDVDSSPTEAMVTAWISTADTIVRLKIVDVTGGVPALADAAASLAQTFIKFWVETQVIRTVYAGKDPVAIAAALKPYSDTADAILKAIEDMGSQAVGVGTAAPRTAVAYTVPDRGLMVTDDELDFGPASPGGSDSSYFRTRKY